MASAIPQLSKMTAFTKLSKKHKKHLREMNIPTLKLFKETAAYHAKVRTQFPKDPDPCPECYEIAKELGLPVREEVTQ